MASAIRVVEVELLRSGPRHNQPLSRHLTYLGVCGEFPAGTVLVPLDQAEMLDHLDDLRFETSSDEQDQRLASVRTRIGDDLGRMLSTVRGLAGELGLAKGRDADLVHLRIVMSAAELALLPFELAKVPVDEKDSGEQWLQLQPNHPVTITRHVRAAPSPSEVWSDEPAILFVSGEDVPFQEHFDALTHVLEPWQSDPPEPRAGDGSRWDSKFLTVLAETDLDTIRACVAERHYTHVHVLAHGAPLGDTRGGQRFGLALGSDVVTGDNLALALASQRDGERRLPAVVTMASCDSAAQGSVAVPGGSVAHDLHAAGIPLVVASQFPISESASVPFVHRFYDGQLCGEHPLVTMVDIRQELATSYGDEHAWASLVVYESLPADFDVHLEALHYWQNRRARDKTIADVEALEPADLLADGGPDRYRRLVDAARAASRRLPTEGSFRAESTGLRGALCKQLAEEAFRLGRDAAVPEELRDELHDDCVGFLVEALDEYKAAVADVLRADRPDVQKKVSIHWVAGQVVVMQAILGEELDRAVLGTARSAAHADLQEGGRTNQAWGHASLIELALLDLAVGHSGDTDPSEPLENAEALVRLVGHDAEQAVNTARQMDRYRSWWGDDEFAAALAARGIEREGWTKGGDLLETVGAVVEALAGKERMQARQATVAAGPAPPVTERFEPAPLLDGAARPTTKTGTFEIEMLPAANGDCLWLSYGAGDELHHVMVDCGSQKVVNEALARIAAVDEVELFILTHIDADHISGAIPLFRDPAVARIKDVWFNGREQLKAFLGVKQGEAFTERLSDPDRPFRWNGVTAAQDPAPSIMTDSAPPEFELDGGMRLTVLSPTREGLRRLAGRWRSALQELDPQKWLGKKRPEPIGDVGALDLEQLAAERPTKDSSVPNLSSIAVLAEYGGRAVLLTGDAHADVLATSIRNLQRQRGVPNQRLRLDALKLSHHGSSNATTAELLDVIECKHYLVPSDGSRFYHPDRPAIARVITRGGDRPVIHFNYRSDFNRFWGDEVLTGNDDHPYETRFPDDGQQGLTVEL